MSSSTTQVNPRAGAAAPLAAGFGGAYPRLLGALALVAAAAAALTFAWPQVLTGPAVMNGSARGTALVVLVVAVPTLAASMGPAARGSVRAQILSLGALAYLTYNAVMFVFGTPFNQLFLLYVAMLSLSVAALIVGVSAARASRMVVDRLPARPIAIYIWVVVLLNALAWLRTIVPALLDERPTAFLDGTGLATNPVFVQDLAFWLPGMALVGFWLWRQRPGGALLAGAGLVFWVIEALGVAVDQWFGAKADPSSGIASASAVPVFAALALVGLVPAWLVLRAIGRASAVTDGSTQSQRT